MHHGLPLALAPVPKSMVATRENCNIIDWVLLNPPLRGGRVKAGRREAIETGSLVLSPIFPSFATAMPLHLLLPPSARTHMLGGHRDDRPCFNTVLHIVGNPLAAGGGARKAMATATGDRRPRACYFSTFILIKTSNCFCVLWKPVEVVFVAVQVYK
jgi:hypothetical protein